MPSDSIGVENLVPLRLGAATESSGLRQSKDPFGSRSFNRIMDPWFVLLLCPEFNIALGRGIALL